MNDRDDYLAKEALSPRVEVTVRIGKAGVSEALLLEMDNQLKSRDMVKVKVNRGLADGREERRQLWDAVAHSTSSRLLVMRGNIAVFTRK